MINEGLKCQYTFSRSFVVIISCFKHDAQMDYLNTRYIYLF